MYQQSWCQQKTTQITLHDQTIARKTRSKSQKTSSPMSTILLSARTVSCDVAIRTSCTRGVGRTCGMCSRGPHRGVRRHPVRADSDCLDVGRRTRDLVGSDGARLARGARDRAEHIAFRAISGNSNTFSVLVADGHARLDRVHYSLTAVRRDWVERRAGEVFATHDGVGCTLRVRVVSVVEAWAQGLGRRGHGRGGRSRDSGAVSIRRGRTIGRSPARCAFPVWWRVVRGWRCCTAAAVDWRRSSRCRNCRLTRPAARYTTTWRRGSRGRCRSER